MSDRYFNHTLQTVQNRWQLRTFAQMWWQLGMQDSQWIPPQEPPPLFRKAIAKQTYNLYEINL